jgi:glycogen debranching enzyme
VPTDTRPSPTTSSPTRPEGAADVVAIAADVLHANWREGWRRDGVPYAFTCPATPRYRHQWYWDSCFHAIAWRHVDAARARAELRTLLRAGRPDGFLPHTAFWDAPAYWRRAPFYATAGLTGSRETESIGPPLVAWAAGLVDAVSPGFVDELRPALERHHDWLERERDVDGDGLISIILPDESGLDDAPKYEPVWGRMTHDRPGYFRAVQRARRLGYRAAELADRHDEHVEDVLVNVLYAQGLHALGDPRATRVEQALLARAWDPEEALFWDLAGPDERPVRVSTWSSLAPIALPGIPQDVKRAVIERHLLHPRRYRAATGIPSVAICEPSFNPRWDRFRCWRGPSWMATAWLLVPPMRELGYTQAADHVVDSLVRAVRRHGLREYYDPLTGRGLGARKFAMSALIIDLVSAPAS